MIFLAGSRLCADQPPAVTWSVKIMKDIKLSFKIGAEPFYAVSAKGGRRTLEIQYFDGILTFSAQYDYDRRPLEMRCETSVGGAVEVILMPHRIELYLNGVIMDEEWPAGERLFELGDGFAFGEGITAERFERNERLAPTVLGEIGSAEGWYPGNGVCVGDCMPYLRDGEYHVLYLKDRHRHGSKWGLGAHQWEHISTSDFKRWKIHPMAVPITEPWEGSICTGSWIRDEGTEYLYYTVRRGRGIPAPICRSVSLDGYHFEKDKKFGFTVSERYHAASARDPKVVKGTDGLFHMLLTTSLVKEGRGCLAHYVSSDMERWQEMAEPIYIAPDKAQPECPDYLEYGGRYYLVFSLHGRARYMVSDRPFEGFREPESSDIPCESVPKGAIWGDRIVFAGFRGIKGYDGSMTFKAARAAENGELIFEEL